ncbi:Phosphopantetheine adenylyltransferase [Mucinivorans hirudinis]|uniref:Phosphopantetheine adenylyltransferase n=1 Tax=Mucinivorans hirudinis TaxID=1433126 RepID=A0A060R5Z7_9BACT|nr:Phosphopantetheine adenylyltransferase [Mucinivorans hirudinis]
MKQAIFPGSFDPFTRAHEDIVRRGMAIFDKIIIAVGENIDKKSLLTTDAKVGLIEEVFANDGRIEVVRYSGLTATLCRQLSINNILRGVRGGKDFEYESNIEAINRMLNPEIETIILLTAPEFAAISSSAVREIIHHGGNCEKFMSQGIDLRKYL